MASIREALESAVSDVEARQSTVTDAPIDKIAPEDIAESERVGKENATQNDKTPEEQAADKPGRTAGRARDDQGRLLPGKAEKIEPVIEAAPAPVVAPLGRPSSWKKDYEPDWQKADRRLQEYVLQREGEFAKGVSTYKQEWDTAKPLIDAVAPFLPTLQKYNITPDRWISDLGRAHQVLAEGSGQEKLQMFAKMAQEYRVPLQALYDPNFAQQYVQQTMQQRPAPQQVDVASQVRQELAAVRTQETIKQFAEAKDATGNLLHPHFEMVRAEMGRKLDAGAAPDLEAAYKAVLEPIQESLRQSLEIQRQADDKAKLEAQRKATAAAKAAAVSVKSATPASPGAGAKKGIRAHLEEAFDQHATGRL